MSSQFFLFPCVAGFTRVMIDMGEEQIWSRDSCVDQGMLSASRVKSVFSRLVIEAIQHLGYGRYVEITIFGSKYGVKETC